jgi:tetratricopeptide (TPR) repeat protein
MSESIAHYAGTPATDASCEVPATAATPATAPPPPFSDTLPPAPPGYEVLGEIGQGGMGVVYRARDCTLDRPVALKFLQQHHAHDPSASRRFLYEAQITGQLQHPGIPPVHQLGTLPDGRPFLAMKLIQGRTLDALLREQGPGAVRWLAVFDAICQAVGYAHSQGVIHRDLKPGNVMVGTFSEVQVMDWGLAKRLSSPTVPTPKPDETDSRATAPPQPGQTPGAAELTRAGSVLGTPAFMPPEQAIGAVDRLDRRSDVFGLGAILCVLLTGKPPFVAADAESSRQLAARARLDDAFAWLDGCAAEPELIALAKRCLSAEQDDRPADAGVLAAAVGQLRQQAEDRARQAEMDRARVEVQAAEQHKRRRLLLVAFGVVIAVLLAGVVGTTLGLIGAEQARREQARLKEQAEEARDLARQRYHLALDAFNQMVFGIQTRLENRPGTHQLRKELLENARQGLRALLREAEKQGNPDRTLLWSHLRMGDVELVLGNTQAAQKQYESAHELAQRLAQTDLNNAEGQRDLSVSFERLGDVMLRLGQTRQALDFYKKRLEVGQRLAQADANNTEAQRDLSISFNKLGDVTRQLGQTREALELYRKGLEVRQRLAQADPNNAEGQRDLSVSFSKLGDLTLKLGQTKEAVAFYQKGLEVSQRLAQADPSNSQAQRDLSVSFIKLGDVALQRGQTKEALDFYHKAREVSQRLAQAGPDNAEGQRDLSVSFNRLGDVTLKRGQAKEALAFYHKSLEARQRLAQADPDNTEAQRDLSISCNKLGDLTLKLGQTKEAVAFYHQSLEVRQRLAQADPDNAQAQMDLFVNYWKLGSAEKARHDYAGAAALFARGRAALLPWHQKKLLVGQASNYLTLVDREMAFCASAEKAISNLDFVFAQKPALIAALLDVRVRALLKQTRVADASSTAQRWADWAEKQQKGRDDQGYKAACALALCAAGSKAKHREALTTKAVAVLTRLRHRGYFKEAARVAHFERNADFAGVRDQQVFAAFARMLKPK